MKFKMIHENYNVADLGKSIAFYEKALDLHEVRRMNALSDLQKNIRPSSPPAPPPPSYGWCESFQADCIFKMCAQFTTQTVPLLAFFPS